MSAEGERTYESPLSPTRSFTIGAGAVTLSFANIFASDDPQVDRIQIYLTNVGGTVLFKAQDFANADYTAASPAVVSATLADTILNEAANTTRSELLRFKFMVERDDRMIWSGSEDAPNAYFWSDVGAPEDIQVLNFRELDEEVTGMSVGINGELIVWGRTRREVVFGAIEDAFSREREYSQGGCVSHNSLTTIGIFTYGLGVDGPFRADAHRYEPIDEVNFNGRVIGSIRRDLSENTDNEEWNRSWGAYDPDMKTWFLTVPSDSYSSDTEYRVYPMQMDIMAWTKYRPWKGDGVVFQRKSDSGDAYKIYGVALRGFLCDIEASDLKDGLTDAQAHEFTVSSRDTTENSLTLSGTPAGSGEATKGLALFKYSATDDTLTEPQEILFQNGTEVWVDDVTNFAATDTVWIGTYDAFYATKGIDARTTTTRRKIFRFLDTEHRLESSGTMFLIFETLDQFETKPWISTAKELNISLSNSSDGRVGIGLSTNRLRVFMGTIDPVDFQLDGFSLEYEQMGVN
jgi:hypothetical protein